jgi:hypothetical protein
MSFEVMYGQGSGPSEPPSPTPSQSPPSQTPQPQQQPQPAQQPGSSFGSEFLTHQDEELLFSIRYPPDWQLKKDQQSVVFTNPAQMAQFKISVLEGARGSPDSTDPVTGVANEMLSSASQKRQGFEVAHKGDPFVMPISDGNSNDRLIAVEFVYDFQDEGRTIRSANMLISAGQILYHISLFAPFENIQYIEQDVLQMLNTFQIDPSVLTLGNGDEVQGQTAVQLGITPSS